MDRRDRDFQWYSRFDEKKMTFIVEDGEGGEVAIPARYEVCGTCDGKGTHVAPGIDAHGLSREDFDDDPDFAESYWRGDYDIPCNECHGRRVAPVVDEKRATKAEAARANDIIDGHYEMEREYEAERRMGA